LLAPVRVGAPRPQQDAVFVGVARGDALRIQVAAFAPAARRLADGRTADGQARTQRGGELQEFAAIEVRHVVPHGAAGARAGAIGATLMPAACARACRKWERLPTCGYPAKLSGLVKPVRPERRRRL
jgi:hypothetical protein